MTIFVKCLVFVLRCPEQNPHKIPSAVQHTQNIYRIIFHTVKCRIVSADKKTVVVSRFTIDDSGAPSSGKSLSIRIRFKIFSIVRTAACSLQSSSAMYAFVFCKSAIASGENFISVICYTQHFFYLCKLSPAFFLSRKLAFG